MERTCLDCQAGTRFYLPQGAAGLGSIARGYRTAAMPVLISSKDAVQIWLHSFIARLEIMLLSLTPEADLGHSGTVGDS